MATQTLMPKTVALLQGWVGEVLRVHNVSVESGDYMWSIFPTPDRGAESVYGRSWLRFPAGPFVLEVAVAASRVDGEDVFLFPRKHPVEQRLSNHALVANLRTDKRDHLDPNHIAEEAARAYSLYAALDLHLQRTARNHLYFTGHEQGRAFAHNFYALPVASLNPPR